MPNFLLLLHQTPNRYENLSPDEIQKIIAKYVNWREGLAARNKLRGGEKLSNDGGKQLRATGGKPTVTDGPYSESQEVLGGFFMIDAADYEEAVSIAGTCPHLTGSQWIEIRKVDPVH